MNVFKSEGPVGKESRGASEKVKGLVKDWWGEFEGEAEYEQTFHNPEHFRSVVEGGLVLTAWVAGGGEDVVGLRESMGKEGVGFDEVDEAVRLMGWLHDVGNFVKGIEKEGDDWKVEFNEMDGEKSLVSRGAEDRGIEIGKKLMAEMGVNEKVQGLVEKMIDCTRFKGEAELTDEEKERPFYVFVQLIDQAGGWKIRKDKRTALRGLSEEYEQENGNRAEFMRGFPERRARHILGVEKIERFWDILDAREMFVQRDGV